MVGGNKGGKEGGREGGREGRREGGREKRTDRWKMGGWVVGGRVDGWGDQ